MLLSRLALRLTSFSERWLPDAYVFALLATLVVFAAALLAGGAPPLAVLDAWGQGFWELVPFTMQMALVIVTGYVLATSRPVARLVVRLARLPRTARGAIVMVALFSMAASWFNWGFSLIFGALLARETARHRPEADYRALGASSFLGLGSVWAQGLSSSAALQMATPGQVSPKLRDIVAAGGVVPGGLVPLRATIFTWQSVVCVFVEIAVVVAVVAAYAPPADRVRTAASLGVALEPLAIADEDDGGRRDPAGARTPAERIERSRWLGWTIAALGLAYLVAFVARSADRLAALNLNTINFASLMLGVALHGTPARLMRAVRDATPATWGVLLQFPFYAGIAGIITRTDLNERVAHALVGLSTRTSFPAIVAAYSGLLGVFVPSGGSKWVIEAPYVLQAAHELKVHLGWTVAVYNLGEALANLVQPFWMLPTLAILGLKARDVMGFTFVVFLALVPVVMILVTCLGATLGYPL